MPIDTIIDLIMHLTSDLILDIIMVGLLISLALTDPLEILRTTGKDMDLLVQEIEEETSMYQLAPVPALLVRLALQVLDQSQEDNEKVETKEK